jgi:hypothetical protein
MIAPHDIFDQIAEQPKYIKTPKARFRIIKNGFKEFFIEEKRWWGWKKLKRLTTVLGFEKWIIAEFNSAQAAEEYLMNNLKRDKEDKEEKARKKIHDRVIHEYTKEGKIIRTNFL